ncbi:hypothetical protein BDF20DRAFT_916263 [Mycotypha africana]|uniref:uncharacterized protein n=1 Tax=Mycotypha africana TaxID=64632 RepID=UPI002301DF7C|nr:uncharacterized protein BDF20DRAFT_916263 [Mycotypha africana]KAI8970461.1 hypothetical protein BDF20DRAFT_916263 [Mycotypha africana]
MSREFPDNVWSQTFKELTIVAKQIETDTMTNLIHVGSTTPHLMNMSSTKTKVKINTKGAPLDSNNALIPHVVEAFKTVTREDCKIGPGILKRKMRAEGGYSSGFLKAAKPIALTIPRRYLQSPTLSPVFICTTTCDSFHLSAIQSHTFSTIFLPIRSELLLKHKLGIFNGQYFVISYFNPTIYTTLKCRLHLLY